MKNMQAGGRTSDLMILSSVCSCSKTHIISSGVAQPQLLLVTVLKTPLCMR